MIYLNDKPLNVTVFPDKTSQVWKLEDSTFDKKYHDIRWTFSHEGEFLHLTQLVQLLKFNHAKSISLTLDYLPYGRQDKEVSNEATFALRSFAWLLNTMKLNMVKILDPHSDMATKLIYNSVAVYPTKLVEQVAQSFGDNADVILCYPDKGAVSKYTKVYETLYRPHIYGEKVRDQLTGNITSYQVVGDAKGKTVLIVDDICDGGMTFKILARDLLAQGAKEVNLFVTHGIFSKGLKTLHESGINKVFTKDGEASEHQNHIIYRKV